MSPQQQAVAGLLHGALCTAPLRHGHRAQLPALQNVSDLSLYLVWVGGDGEIVLLGELPVVVYLHALPVALVGQIALHNALEAVGEFDFLVRKGGEHLRHILPG